MTSKTPSDDIRNADAAQADDRNSAAAAPANNRESDLLPVRDIAGFDFDARVDIRGWRVYSNDPQLVGVVDSLFADRRTNAVRYVGVTLVRSGDVRGTPGSGIVIVPVGAASRSGDRRAIVLNGLSAEHLQSAPRILNRTFTHADESATLAAYGMPTLSDSHGSDRYNGPLFEERRLIAMSRPERGD